MTDSTSKKILIAEDERPMAKALEVKLQNSGFDARSVFDGEEAISVLKNNSYDLLLLDLLMPTIDGWKVLEYVQTMDTKPHVIITSNLSQEEDIARAQSLGAADFLVKSNTTLDEIVQKITNLLS